MGGRRPDAVTLDEPGLLQALHWEDAQAVADHLAGLVDPGAGSLARRDAALLALHRDRYGELLRCAGDCPTCGESLEVLLPVAELLPEHAAEGDLRVIADGLDVTFRLPSAGDVRAASDERVLAASLVAAVHGPDGTAVELPAGWLPSAALLAAMDEAMAQRHPSGGLTIDISCAACGGSFSAPLDVAEQVAARARADALALVAEVHALASAYGWSEAEVLAVPRARRRRYLELVGA